MRLVGTGLDGLGQPGLARRASLRLRPRTHARALRLNAGARPRMRPYPALIDLRSGPRIDDHDVLLVILRGDGR